MGPFIFQANGGFRMRAKILGLLAVFVAFFAVLPSVGQDGPQVPHAKPYVDLRIRDLCGFAHCADGEICRN